MWAGNCPLAGFLLRKWVVGARGVGGKTPRSRPLMVACAQPALASFFVRGLVTVTAGDSEGLTWAGAVWIRQTFRGYQASEFMEVELRCKKIPSFEVHTILRYI